MSPVLSDLKSRWARLARRDRQMLLLMTGALAVFALFQWVIFPILDRESGETELKGPSDELARMKGWIEVAPALEREVLGLEAQSAMMEARLLPAASPQLASASLQKEVERLARQMSAEVQSVQLGEPKDQGERLLRIPMALDVRGPLGVLLPLLHALEMSQRPAMIVEKMEFRRGNARSPDEYLMRLELYALHAPKGAVEKVEARAE